MFQQGFSRCILALTVALLPVPWAAADNLSDVYDAAVDHDPVVGAARATYQAQREGVPQARSQLLPNVTASANTSWNERSFPGSAFIDSDPTSPTFGQAFEFPEQEYNEHFWQARLSQPIVNLESWFALRSAKSAVTGAEKQLEGTEQNLIVRVIQAYVNVLRAQDLLDSTHAEEAAVKRQLEQVQQRFDVGLVAITDVLEAQAAYDNSVVRRIQADGDHDIFFETLRTLTGINHESLDRLSEQLPIVNPEPRNEEEWVSTALATNLGIAAATAQLRSAERTLRSRKAAHLPTVDATATHSRIDTNQTNSFGLIGNSTPETENTVYALQLNLPVFLGGFNHSRRKEAGALAEQARQQLQDQRLTVSRDTRNLFQSVATDVVRVRARLKAIKSSQSALEATQTGYEVGTRNIVDVLQAQQRLFSAQFDYADSRYNYVVNLMRLKQAAGTLNEADLRELNAFTDSNNPVKRLNSLRNYSGEFSSP